MLVFPAELEAPMPAKPGIFDPTIVEDRESRNQGLLDWMCLSGLDDSASLKPRLCPLSGPGRAWTLNPSHILQDPGGGPGVRGRIRSRVPLEHSSLSLLP